MSICSCIYMYVCIYVYVRMYVYMCRYVCMYIRRYGCVHTLMMAQTHACTTYVTRGVCVRVCLCVCVCVCVASLQVPVRCIQKLRRGGQPEANPVPEIPHPRENALIGRCQYLRGAGVCVECEGVGYVECEGVVYV